MNFSVEDEQRKQNSLHIKQALADLPGEADRKKAALDMLVKCSQRDASGQVVIVRNGMPFRTIRDAYESLVSLDGKLIHADELARDPAAYARFRKQHGLDRR